MPPWLCDDVSFCRVNRHLVFLDVGSDRYFRLPHRLEQAFAQHLEGGALAESDRYALAKRNIPIDAPGAPGLHLSPSIPSPARSALEQPPSAQSVSIVDVFAVFAIVCSVYRQLQVRGLKSTLATLVEHRHARTCGTPAWNDQRLSAAAIAFRQARRHVPVDTTCLLDAIALVRFLSRRGVHAYMVFGVADAPFSAHAWVQRGDLVLDDTVGNASGHVPIRVV